MIVFTLYRNFSSVSHDFVTKYYYKHCKFCKCDSGTFECNLSNLMVSCSPIFLIYCWRTFVILITISLFVIMIILYVETYLVLLFTPMLHKWHRQLWLIDDNWMNTKIITNLYLHIKDVQFVLYLIYMPNIDPFIIFWHLFCKKHIISNIILISTELCYYKTGHLLFKFYVIDFHCQF